MFDILVHVVQGVTVLIAVIFFIIPLIIIVARIIWICMKALFGYESSSADDDDFSAIYRDSMRWMNSKERRRR